MPLVHDASFRPKYQEWQTWKATPHPMVPLPDEDSEICNPNYPTWKMTKVNFSNTVEGDRDIATVEDVEGEEEDDDAEEVRKDAAQDSNIFMPTQVAVSTRVRADGDDNCKHGVHWRVEKELPLFMGQDFFIEFHRKTETTDVSNFDIIKEWKNDPDKKYEAINSNIDLPGITGPFDSAVPPPNHAVRTYDTLINKDSNSVTGYVSDEKSSRFYDLNRQAYYIVELGSDLWDLSVPDTSESIDKEAKYFIIIPQNYKPTFIKLAKPEGSSKYVAYNLSSYDATKGADLIDKKENLE